MSKVKEMKGLRHIVMGKLDNSTDNIRIDRKVWEVLSKLTGLGSITFNST
jgi:hypothetical protein